ncbi:MAG: FkbM family methyltransferase [Longimicrobiales bacterium]
MQLPYFIRLLGHRAFGNARARIRSGRNRGRWWSAAALGRGYGSGRFGWDRIEALAAVTQDGDAFWDVGAHKGFVSLAASSMVGPLGIVVAIEPAADNLRFLERHLAWNGIENARVVPAAVSDWNGVGTIGGSGSSVAFRLGSGPEEIPVRTIDLLAVELDLGRPTVLKIDVEGEEAAVLRGARRLLGTDQAILISTHSRALYEECRALLEPLGFRIYDSWEITEHRRDGTPWSSDHDVLAIGRDRRVAPERIKELRLIAGSR